MNFDDEPYVKMYTRQTLGTKLAGWDGRAVLRALLLHTDRAGVLDLDGYTPAQALSALEEMPIELVEPAMAKLLAQGTVEHRGNVLFIPNKMRAQEARPSDAQRQRESRARRADMARARDLGLVTKCDEPKSGVGAGRPDTVREDTPEAESGTHRVTNRDEHSDFQSQSVTECSPKPAVGHSQIRSEDQRPDEIPPPKDLTGSARDPETTKTPCPPDLELLPAQRANMRMGQGATDYQLDQLTVKFRTRFMADPSDTRPLVAWRKCLAMTISQDLSDPKRRPPREPSEETAEQSHARLRRGQRQPNAHDHSTEASHLKAIGGTVL